MRPFVSFFEHLFSKQIKMRWDENTLLSCFSNWMNGILRILRLMVKLKGKVLPYSLPSVGPGADLKCTGQSARRWLEAIHPAVGCYCFPPGLRLPSHPLMAKIIRSSCLGYFKPYTGLILANILTTSVFTNNKKEILKYTKSGNLLNKPAIRKTT